MMKTMMKSVFYKLVLKQYTVNKQFEIFCFLCVNALIIAFFYVHFLVFIKITLLGIQNLHCFSFKISLGIGHTPAIPTILGGPWGGAHL